PFCYTRCLSLVFIILGQKALTPCCFADKSRPFLVVPQPFAALLSVKTCSGLIIPDTILGGTVATMT
ncbi:hypothetical protein, partial [Aeromonas allosaccharophila]|uniref:hypothetical protein n=1 Tax=Aeromonas allosaccharophila TaxID=656 RepID=UPI0036DD3749